MNSGAWVNAVEGNSGGTSTMILGAYNPATDFVLGNWGVDIEANNVWAVLNYNGEFAVPEPSTALSLLAIGTLAVCRRRRKQAA